MVTFFQHDTHILNSHTHPAVQKMSYWSNHLDTRECNKFCKLIQRYFLWSLPSISIDEGRRLKVQFEEWQTLINKLKKCWDELEEQTKHSFMRLLLFLPLLQQLLKKPHAECGVTLNKCMLNKCERRARLKETLLHQVECSGPLSHTLCICHCSTIDTHTHMHMTRSHSTQTRVCTHTSLPCRSMWIGTKV